MHLFAIHISSIFPLFNPCILYKDLLLFQTFFPLYFGFLIFIYFCFLFYS